MTDPDSHDAVALIAEKRAEYEASDAFQNMRQSEAAELALCFLMRAAKISRRGACVAAAAYIDEYGAGLPEVEWWSEEKILSDAKLWSARASQPELEAYLVAALDAISESLLLERQIKRMGAIAFHRMDSGTKEAYKKWINAQ